MKVKYVRARDFQSEMDPSLTLGRVYIVISINFESNGNPHTVSVPHDEDGYPILININHFDIVEHKLPNDWCIRLLQSGAYRIGPIDFLGNFWDKYHDGHPDSERLYETVVRKIKEFHGIKD